MIVFSRYRVLNRASKLLMGDRIVSRSPLRSERGQSENYVYYCEGDANVEVCKQLQQLREVQCEEQSDTVVLVYEDDVGEKSEMITSRAEMERLITAYRKAKRFLPKHAGRMIKRGDEKTR